MRFIKLTARDGMPVFVNPQHVLKVNFVVEGGGSCLQMTDHSMAEYQENPQMVCDMIEAATRGMLT